MYLPYRLLRSNDLLVPYSVLVSRANLLAHVTCGFLLCKTEYQRTYKLTTEQLRHKTKHKRAIPMIAVRHNTCFDGLEVIGTQSLAKQRSLPNPSGLETITIDVSVII